MSVPMSPSDSPEITTDHLTCARSDFGTHWLPPSTVVITADGDLDASNAAELAEYALRYANHTEELVLDLSRVEFFGTAGFSALHTLNVRCAGHKIQWAMVPSAAVTRLLRICDPDSTLPMSDDIGDAVRAVQSEPRRLLQLVSQTS